MRRIWATIRQQATKEPQGIAANIVNAAWQHLPCWTIFILANELIREELQDIVSHEIEAA